MHPPKVTRCPRCVWITPGVRGSQKKLTAHLTDSHGIKPDITIDIEVINKPLVRIVYQNLTTREIRKIETAINDVLGSIYIERFVYGLACAEHGVKYDTASGIVNGLFHPSSQ